MSTPNGFDPLWVEAINTVLAERESAVRIRDITGQVWDMYIGPMCDAIEWGELDNQEMYSIHPTDVCEYPECDRTKALGGVMGYCRFHELGHAQRMGLPVSEAALEQAFMESD